MQLSNKSAMLENKNTSCSNIIINKVSQSNNAIIYTWTCMKLLKLCKKKKYHRISPGDSYTSEQSLSHPPLIVLSHLSFNKIHMTFRGALLFKVSSEADTVSYSQFW